MTGRRVLVTGATSGLGEAIAAGLARLGAAVHVLGRSPEHLASALDRLERRVPSGGFTPELCDLSDLDDVRRFAGDLTGRTERLHGLVHNAGTLTEERRETRDGHEVQLATHVLGPHLLTAGLLELLDAAVTSSVVFVSSAGMYPAGLHEDDPEFREGSYSGIQAYARTKRMQVVLARAWARRLAASGIRVESMHPGWVDTPGVRRHLPTLGTITGPLLRSPEEGADTVVWLVATRPSSRGGQFWHDRARRPVSYLRPAPDDEQETAFLEYVGRATQTSGVL
jgi:dehydrogenase/reductase SDR family protein 12